MKTIFVTQAYFDALAEKIKGAKTRLAHARLDKSVAIKEDTNGWHDNFAFEHAMRAERMAEDEIRILSGELNACQISNGPCERQKSPDSLCQKDAQCATCSCVEFWTTVKVINIKTGGTRELSIVPIGADDAINNIFSYIAPIAAPLMGAKNGDIVNVTLPSEIIELEVLEIRRFSV